MIGDELITLKTPLSEKLGVCRKILLSGPCPRTCRGVFWRDSRTYPTGLDGSGDPAGDATTTWYDARSLPYRVLQPDSRIITSRHNGLGSQTYLSVPHAQSDATPAATTLTYYLSGAKKDKTDPAGITTTYDSTIDPPGRDGEHPVRIDNPVSGTTTFTYTHDGEVASKTTSAGTFSYTYDSQGQLIKTDYPSGNSAAAAYDALGNQLTDVFIPSGATARATTMTYTADSKLDVRDEPSPAGEPNGIDTDHTYSPSTGQVEKTVLDDDASFVQETRFAYDAAGRLDSQTLEAGADDPLTDYAYEDKSGWLKETDRPDGIDDRYAYDSRGRVSQLKAVKDSDSSWQAGDTYSYDSQDRISTRTSRHSGTSYATSYTYDPAGQLTSETSANGIVRTYTYGDANAATFGSDLQRHTLHLTNAPAGTLPLARIDEIEECLSEATDCAAADETAIDTALTAILEPGTLMNPASSTSVAAEVAQWLKLRDNRGWEASQVYELGECIDPGAWGGTRYKVTARTGANSSGSNLPTFTSSPITDGDLTWTADTCTPILVTHSYQYDTNTPSKHQLVSQANRFGASVSYTYDSRGNQITRGPASQTFDELNRATSLRDETGSEVTLTWYRAERKLKSWTAGGVTRILQYDADGRVRVITASGGASWTSEYAYDHSGLASFKTGGAWYYLDRNTRGDITGIRDASGALQATIRYSAYGEVWTDNQTLVDKLAMTYNGRDGVVSLGGGLYWMEHRNYSAFQGRFLGADPREVTAGTTASAYNYGDGDPVNNADPTGLGITCDFGRPKLRARGHVFRLKFNHRCWGSHRWVGGWGLQFCVAALQRYNSPYTWDPYFRCKWSLGWAGSNGSAKVRIVVPAVVRWCQFWSYSVTGWAWAPGTWPGRQYFSNGLFRTC